MSLKIYQVDAFAEGLFSGNPAAVCPLGNEWLEDSLMQKIALENNLSETAFYIYKDGQYHIRWFTPTVEIALCGHATLATAFVLFNCEKATEDKIIFSSMSGNLSVQKEGDLLLLDFPTDSISQVEKNEELLECFDLEPKEIYRGKTDYMFVYDHEEQIQDIEIHFDKIKKVDCRSIIITAKGSSKYDFVSRCFCPSAGIDEDPATGSAHTTLTPYWSQILNKKEFSSLQLSERKGYFLCRDKGNRTEILGKGILYLQGMINV